VVAVVERLELRGRPDAIVFVAAKEERRAVGTENVADLRRLAAEALQHGRSHSGLIFTTDRPPRHDPRTVGCLITALDRVLSGGSEAEQLEHWLS